MRNQRLAPARASAPPVDCAFAQVSVVQWTMFGEQAGPVRSAEAAPLFRWTLFFSRTSPFTAMAMALLFTSRMASTPSRSNHCRATFMPTSGLFWWSAWRISTVRPRAAAPKSCAACRASTTQFGPLMSRYGPDMSDSTPIRMDCGCACARAVPPRPAAAAAAKGRASAPRLERVIPSVPPSRPALRRGGPSLGRRAAA